VGFILKRTTLFKSRYEKGIDLARISVAIAFGVFGAILLLCVRVAHQRETVGLEATEWRVAAIAFGIAMLLCLAATLTLVIEGVVRFCINLLGGRPFQFSLRTLLIIMTLLAVLCGFIASIVP
jgi:hypothetical protein